MYRFNSRRDVMVRTESETGGIKLLEIADAGAREMKMSNAKRYVAGLGKNG